MPRKVATEEEKDAMVADYVAGKTSIEAAGRHGCGYQACIRALRSRGVPLRSRSEAHRRIAVDETFFDAIDTEAKAYFFGWMATDGHTRPQVFQLVLQRRDRGVLEAFAHALQWRGKIGDIMARCKTGEYPASRLVVCSTYLCNRLRALGVGCKKPERQIPQGCIPDALMHHYLRGVFDGDGSGGPTLTHGILQWKFRLFGSPAILQVMAEAVRIWSGLRVSVLQRRPNSFAIDTCGHGSILKIVEGLYAGATLFLARKRAKYDLLCGSAEGGILSIDTASGDESD